MNRLDVQERRFIDELLRWERRRVGRAEEAMYHLLLAVGTLVFAVAVYALLRRMDDGTAVWTVLPGALTVVVCALGYLLGESRVRQRRIMASILRKLGAED